MSISLAVDILQTVEHHEAHPQHGVEGPGVLAAAEELVKVGAESVDDEEPELDLLEGEGAAGVQPRHRHRAQLPVHRLPVRAVTLQTQTDNKK